MTESNVRTDNPVREMMKTTVYELLSAKESSLKGGATEIHAGALRAGDIIRDGGKAHAVKEVTPGCDMWHVHVNNSMCWHRLDMVTVA